MDVGNAGYAWSNYLPRRRRKYVHGRSRLPASHVTYTSMYVVGLNVASMPHTLDLQGRLRLLPLACISTIHGGHVGNADYTGAIICLTQTPDIKNLRINLKYAE